MSRLWPAVLFLAMLPLGAAGVPDEIPAPYSSFGVDGQGVLHHLDPQGVRRELVSETPAWTLKMLRGSPVGTASGIRFTFTDPAHALVLAAGTLTYGLESDGAYNLPVFFKQPVPIVDGKAEIPIAPALSGKYDMSGWRERGAGTLGYRVADGKGYLLYEGRVAFTGTGPFAVDTTIIAGPCVALLGPDRVTIAFDTDRATQGFVELAGRRIPGPAERVHHEIEVVDLDPGKKYEYRVVTADGRHSRSGSFTTAPAPGSRKPFTFAYASDCRAATGGGERDFGGVNFYVMRRIGALAADRRAAFLQFTGDLVNGYCNSPDRIRAEYANWKRAVEPFAAHLPIVAGMGNHEAVLRAFHDGTKHGIQVDRFPYSTQSAEAVFAAEFVNPRNGPASEDGSAADADPGTVDFPPYSETVFSYVYDNVAMVVLNSDYWYAPMSQERRDHTGGNLHGYPMDNQIAWLETTLDACEGDERIDHVFVTQHTPILPNGGHVADDMWYGGSNRPRPVAFRDGVRWRGEGIIERRDRLLRILLAHGKVRAVPTGDEHNYNKLLLTGEVDLYGARPIPDLPKDHERLTVTRPLWLINNGAAGAPYYGREETPWAAHVESFTTRNALVFFHVDGKEWKFEVIDPVTLERIE
jgi:hypothetical protein